MGETRGVEVQEGMAVDQREVNSQKPRREAGGEAYGRPASACGGGPTVAASQQCQQLGRKTENETANKKEDEKRDLSGQSARRD